MFNKILFTVLLFSAAVLYSEKLPKLTITTEKWKPFQYMENGKVQGVSVDIMMLMLQELGSKQNRDDIKILPWSRAYNSALKNDNTVLFLTARTQDRESLFKWVGPVLSYNSYLIIRKDSNIVIDDIEMLDKLRVGSVRDDASEVFLQDLGVPLDRMIRGSKGSDVVNILDKGRIDILLSEWTSFVSDVEFLGLNLEDFEPVYLASQSELYYAFSSTISDDIILKFQTSLDELKESGQMDKIFLRYGERGSDPSFFR